VCAESGGRPDGIPVRAESDGAGKEAPVGAECGRTGGRDVATGQPPIANISTFGRSAVASLRSSE
jgi:hypothetical protein